MTSARIVLIAALAVAVAGPAVTRAQDADSDRAHPGDFVKDSAITTKIKSKLAADHPGSLAHIRVDTDRNGVVWLSGTAKSREAVVQAEDIALHTEGVRSVKNHIEVRADD